LIFVVDPAKEDGDGHVRCLDCKLDGEKPDADWSKTTRQVMGVAYFIILNRYIEMKCGY